MPRLLASIAALALSGCALIAPRAPRPPALPLLPPAALGATQAVVQNLNIAYGDRELDLQAAVRAEPDHLTLIALGPLGQRAFTVRYDGHDVRADVAADAAGSVPSSFPPERVLADLQFALWPLAAWQAGLAGSEWQITEPQPGLRRLRWRGQLIAEVHAADPADPWHSRLWLGNYADGYSLAITPQTP